MPSVQASSLKGDTNLLELPAVQVRIVPLSPPFPRSKDEWRIGEEGRDACLKARVGAAPDQPPTTGWKFFNYDTNKHEVDESLSCSSNFVSSIPCCLTISLSGAAKQVQGKCEGEYKSTGLVSAGRLVMII